MRNVRKRGQQLAHAPFNFIPHTGKPRDSLLQLTDLTATPFGFLTLAFLHERADSTAGRVALCVELVGFSNHAATLRIGTREVVERRRRKLSRRQRLAHFVQIVANEVEIEHLPQPSVLWYEKHLYKGL
jgi:hypothetical protein